VAFKLRKKGEKEANRHIRNRLNGGGEYGRRKCFHRAANQSFIAKGQWSLGSKAGVE